MCIGRPFGGPFLIRRRPKGISFRFLMDLGFHFGSFLASFWLVVACLFLHRFDMLLLSTFNAFLNAQTLENRAVVHTGARFYIFIILRKYI